MGSKSEDADLDWEVRPQFIYGGPFVQPVKVEPFMNTATPVGMQLQGTFKKSFAYYSLKERLPIILTKVIDYLSRDMSSIKSKYNASDDDIRKYMQYVTKLKNDLITNKNYDLLTVETADAKKWNLWIESQDPKRYFNNTWIFTECYVYRRLREGCELAATLKNFDPFDVQKDQSFMDSLEPMCIVADKFVTMLTQSEKDKRKADFITLLKLCLWANKCDLSLSAGAQVTLSGQKADKKTDTNMADEKKTDVKMADEKNSTGPFDPFQMIIDLKDKLLVDDTAKIVDNVISKADAIRKAIEGNQSLKIQCSCHRLAALAGMPLCKEAPPPQPSLKDGNSSPSPATSPPDEQTEGEAPKIPCPTKMVIAQSVFFDIICDNAGYELFADLCLAHFLIAQNIVQKIRFHVKAMPWFVSDVTERDFKFVIDSCTKANFSRTIAPEPKPAAAEGEPAPAEEPRVISADNLRSLGEQWNKYLADGTFLVMAEDYWTWPHLYKDMKRIDYNLYRKLQYACALLFKGDLNYRKLLGEKKWNPYIGFEASLQGFIPAPIIAARTVKCELISGMPKGKYEQLNKLDEKWMEKGDYGVIQFCAKAEALKVSDRPCIDYGVTCFGTVCPVHQDM